MARYARELQGKSQAWLTVYRQKYAQKQKAINKAAAIKVFGQWVSHVP